LQRETEKEEDSEAAALLVPGPALTDSESKASKESAASAKPKRRED